MNNIIFDLGGVVLDGNPVSILNKLDINEADYNKMICFFDNWDKLDLGQQSLEEKFLECNFPEYIYSKYKETLLKYYEIRDVNMNIIELMKKLKLNNNKIFILSDNNSEAIKYYQNNSLFNDIDGWVVSCDYNTLKKNGKLFETLLDKYKLLPEECYYIDDKQSNIDIASNYNIIGYRYDDNIDIIDLYNNMRNNGIKI